MVGFMGNRRRKKTLLRRLKRNGVGIDVEMVGVNVRLQFNAKWTTECGLYGCYSKLSGENEEFYGGYQSFYGTFN